MIAHMRPLVPHKDASDATWRPLAPSCASQGRQWAQQNRSIAECLISRVRVSQSVSECLRVSQSVSGVSALAFQRDFRLGSLTLSGTTMCLTRAPVGATERPLAPPCASQGRQWALSGAHWRPCEAQEGAYGRSAVPSGAPVKHKAARVGAQWRPLAPL